jgi:hypothetical protein
VDLEPQGNPGLVDRRSSALFFITTLLASVGAGGRVPVIYLATGRSRWPFRSSSVPSPG